MKKIMGMVLAMVLTLVMCSVPALGEATQYPLTITNYNYAKEQVPVTFSKAPERVVVGYQNVLEIMLKLGLADRIAIAFGLDGEVSEDLKGEFAKINYVDTRPSKEDIIALEPDAILSWYSLFSDKNLGDVAFWHERGIGTSMALNSACRGPAAEFPQTIEHEWEDILTLGQIFDRQAEAQAIVEEMKAEISKIEAHIAGKEPVKIAVLENEGDAFRIYGEDTVGGNIAIHAGADLAIGKHGEERTISAEGLIETDPEMLFMVWFDGYNTAEQCVSDIVDNPAYASLSAVKNGKVYAINLSEIYCPGLRSYDGILTFASRMYPELYP